MLESITTNYQKVLARIERAARGSGRNPSDVTLVAVTKTWPAEVVLAAYEAGMRHFGENRPEELAAKRGEIEKVIGPDSGIVWHGIGDLQSRKTNVAAENTDVFHALDRFKIARRLSQRLQELGRSLPVMVEVNVSGEESKAGFDASEWETNQEQRRALLSALEAFMEFPELEVVGLMTMAPWDAPEAQIRRVFSRTRQLSLWLQEQKSGMRRAYLSMGMTDDFEIAIEEGATHIRVGRAIFGERG